MDHVRPSLLRTLGCLSRQLARHCQGGWLLGAVVRVHTSWPRTVACVKVYSASRKLAVFQAKRIICDVLEGIIDAYYCLLPEDRNGRWSRLYLELFCDFQLRVKTGVTLERSVQACCWWWGELCVPRRGVLSLDVICAVSGKSKQSNK